MAKRFSGYAVASKISLSHEVQFLFVLICWLWYFYITWYSGLIKNTNFFSWPLLLLYYRLVIFFRCSGRKWNKIILILFRMGGQKAPPPLSYQFFPCNVYKRKNYPPKIFWVLALTLLTNWFKISKPYLLPVRNCETWKKATSQKNYFFGSSSYKIEFMITCLIEMPELPNFGHMTISTM